MHIVAIVMFTLACSATGRRTLQHMRWHPYARRGELPNRFSFAKHDHSPAELSQLQSYKQLGASAALKAFAACLSAFSDPLAAWLVPDAGQLFIHANRPPLLTKRADVNMQSADLKPAGAWLEAVGGKAGWDEGTKLAQTKKPKGPPAFLTDVMFDSMDIRNGFLQNLNKLGLTKMTDIQEQTFKHAVEGKDILARARTGTGKTIAFLLPVLERFAADQQKGMKHPRGLHCVVISPTRELAQQICAEGQSIMEGSPKLTIDYCVGGTNMNAEARRLRTSATGTSLNVLVATPGRFLDHAQSTEGFSEWLQSVQVLILDEADRLLEMGFRQEIEKILKLLPQRDYRQNLLFSATVAPEIRDIAKKMLKQDSVFVDTVGEAESTHEAVAQQICTVPFEQSVSALAAALYKHMDENPSNYKIIVFFSTARVTGFMSQFFNSMGLPVLEQHSRKTQKAREKTTATFKAASRAILFSSDVSARGMDFPDVTLIIQVGLTEREQYIHRLGRTARSTGARGSGILLAAPFEKAVLKKTLRGLPIEGLIAKGAESMLDVESTLTPSMHTALSDATSRVPLDSDLLVAAQRAYGAWLGFYKSNLKGLGWTAEECVKQANIYSKVLGCSEIPALEAKTVGKMGLKGVRGVNIAGKGVISGGGGGGPKKSVGGAGRKVGDGAGGKMKTAAGMVNSGRGKGRRSPMRSQT